MLSSLEIKPKEGFGKINFLSSMSDVEKHFGIAEEIEEIEDTEDYKTVIWHYWEKGYSLFFDVNVNNVFTCVEIDNEEAVLWGKRVFGMNEEEIKDLFKNKGYASIDVEEHEWGEKRVSFDEALVDFYFEDDVLVSINFGIFADEHKILIFPN